MRATREYSRGKYQCTIDLLFDWFGFSCMTTEFFCFYLKNRLVQTSQTGGQLYSDASPFCIPWSNILKPMQFMRAQNKVAGVKVYPRQLQMPCSTCMHQPVTSQADACTYCMHFPMTSQADACSYCMGSKPCLQILAQGGSERPLTHALAYYDMTTIMALKSFIVQGPGQIYNIITIWA